MTIQTKTLEEENKIVLSESETIQVEWVFAEAKDFRSIWEKITAPLDSIISETAKIIDKDPIMNVSTELNKVIILIIY